MQDLINVKNENGQLLVSARDLHEYFESKERFSKWFDRMCEYGFEEDMDFTSVKKSTVVNNGAIKEIGDYACSINMAKEIAMIQRSEKGKQARKYFIECERQLKQVAIQSPQAFVDSLKLHEYHIEKYLPSFLTWKNVDEVMPLLIERVGNSIDSGEIKLGVLHSVIKVTRQVRDLCELSAQKEIMTKYIEEAQSKYDRVLIASKAGVTKANNELKKKLEEKDKEIKKVETKRLCEFSDKALKRAYKESGYINTLVNEFVNDVIEDDLYKTFTTNLEINVGIIVKLTGMHYREAHMAIYKRMGIESKGRFSTYTEYIFYNQREGVCLLKAAELIAELESKLKVSLS